MRGAPAAILLMLGAAQGGDGAAPAAAAAHVRVLPLEGGRNFRDLGGYPAAGGKTVRWGLLYRSGSMAGLTPRDYETLDRLGIRAVCDLRTAEERDAEPTRWGGAHRPDYWTSDIAATRGDLTKLLSGEGAAPTAASVQAAMLGLYRDLPDLHAPAYREIFRCLVAGRAPLAFNCTAGKDRTGVAAALILSALGVPRAAVLEDFALSDKVSDLTRVVRDDRARGANTMLGQLAMLPPDVIAPMLRSDPAYLAAAFAAIEERHGSVDAYLATLGVGAKERAVLRRRYLA